MGGFRFSAWGLGFIGFIGLIGLIGFIGFIGFRVYRVWGLGFRVLGRSFRLARAPSSTPCKKTPKCQKLTQPLRL